jgi:DNA polymerase III delta subunit
MTDLAPLYLIHGDDHPAVKQRRGKLKALAQQQSGVSGVETIDAKSGNASELLAALDVTTLAIGQRVIVVDGVQAWSKRDITKKLTAALHDLPEGTTVAMFGYDQGRSAVPGELIEAVKDAGGHVVAAHLVAEQQLAGWTVQQAQQLGMTITRDAAELLVTFTAQRQQRILRELEKLELANPGGEITAEVVRAHAANSSEYQAFALAGALSGNTAEAIRRYLRLMRQGERPDSLIYTAASRATGRTALTLGLMEVNLRGGHPISAIRHPEAGLTPDTQALLAIRQITAPAKETTST